MDPNQSWLHKLWLVVGWLLVLIVIYFSLSTSTPQLGIRHSDKIGHFMAYGVLMWWWLQLYAPSRRPFIAIALIAQGVTLEFIQDLTSYRQFEYLDILMNTVGVATAWLIGKTPLTHALPQLEKRLLNSS